MPNRIIKESIRTSKTLAALSAFAEVCFYRLIVTVDDYGCFFRDPQILKSQLFPRNGELSVGTIDEALCELERVGLIHSYQADGEIYLHMETWEKHQRVRSTKRKFPAPDIIAETRRNSPQSAANDSDLQQSAAENDDGKKEESSENQVKSTVSSGNEYDPAEIRSNPRQIAASGGKLRPYSYSYSYSGEGEENARARARPSSAPFASDEELQKISEDHNEIFDRLTYVGFTLNQKLMDDVVAMYSEYGKEVLLEAIDSCAGASGNKLAYLRGVLKHWGEKKHEIDDEDDELESIVLV